MRPSYLVRSRQGETHLFGTWDETIEFVVDQGPDETNRWSIEAISSWRDHRAGNKDVTSE